MDLVGPASLYIYLLGNRVIVQLSSKSNELALKVQGLGLRLKAALMPCLLRFVFAYQSPVWPFQPQSGSRPVESPSSL